MRSVGLAKRLSMALGGAKLRTYPSAQRKSAREIFSRRDRSYKELVELETRYLQGGPVREAIDAYALMTMSNGWYVDGEDEALVQEVEDRLDELDISSSIWQGIVDALVFGDAFQELARGAGSRANDIVAIIPRPARMFDIITDEYGRLLYYEQFLDGTMRERSIRIEPRDMLHISLFHSGGSKYGLSLIASAKDDIDRDTRMISSLVDSIEAHGKPRYHARVGQPGEDVPQTVLDRIADQLDALQTNSELVTGRDTEIVVLDSAGVANTKIYSDLTIQRMACALGVPEEILGLGRGSTEATATVRQRVFENKIGTIQKRLERIYNDQLIDQITGRPGAVRLRFNDISPEDELREVQYVTAVLNADPIRPLASRAWAQQRLRLPVDEDDTEDVLAGIGGWDGVSD